jgi:hypothetical protein
LYSVSWRTETRPTRDPSGATVIGGWAIGGCCIELCGCCPAGCICSRF